METLKRINLDQFKELYEQFDQIYLCGLIYGFNNMGSEPNNNIDTYSLKYRVGVADGIIARKMISTST